MSSFDEQRKEYEREVNKIERETTLTKVILGVILFTIMFFVISLMFIWMI